MVPDEWVAEMLRLTTDHEGMCRGRNWTTGHDCGGRFCGSAEEFHVIEPEADVGLWEEVH